VASLVNPISLVIVAIAGIAFFGLGGVGKIKAFGEQFKTQDQTEQVSSGDTSIKTGGQNVEAGSQAAVSDIVSAQVLSGSIQSKRKVSTGKITGITTAQAATDAVLRKLASPAGSGVAQFSTGQVGSLSAEEREQIARRELTDVERSDIQKLDARRQRAIESGINPNLKLSGAELILRKREQEALSIKSLQDRFGGQVFTNGKLFANPDFESGGLTAAEASRRLSTQAEIQENIRLNAIQKQKEIAEGTEILKTVGTTAAEQKETFAKIGVDIQGGNVLSPRALAKLRAKGIQI